MTEAATTARHNAVAATSDELRDEVRAWLAGHVPDGWRERQSGATQDEYTEFQRWWFAEMRSGGYLVPHWPKEHGGGGFSIAEQVVLHEEVARAGAPRLQLHFASLYHLPATLLHAGSEAQIARHLPAILEGTVWCQGFSEPEAGSDLASLRTRAKAVDGGYLISGQKLWTSMAEYADWCMLLARTDPTAPPHHGISLFLLDMRSPGVELRALRQASGAAEFCELFLDDVFVPNDCLVGAVNDGWRIAQSTLSAERGLTMLELTERLRFGFRRLVEQLAADDSVELADAWSRDALGASYAELEALRYLCGQLVDQLVAHGGVGVEASVVKVIYSEALQRFATLAVELEGLPAQISRGLLLGAGWESGHAMQDFINSWMWTIAGGTNEIQRNVIGERMLGLPREPRATL